MPPTFKQEAERTGKKKPTWLTRTFFDEIVVSWKNFVNYPG